MKTLSPFALAEKMAPHVYTMLLYGKMPGSGKTTFGLTKGLRDGMAVVSEQFQQDQGTDKLLGSWRLVPDKKSGAPVMTWEDGSAVIAMRKSWEPGGCRLVVDELHKASPEGIAAMHKITDDPRWAVITLPTGEVVRPNPDGFQVFATMNAEPDEMEEPIMSRFPVRVHVVEPNPEAIQALPADLQAIALETACHEDDDRRISLRHWTAFAKYRQTAGVEAAAQSIFAHRAQQVLDALAVARAR